MINILITNLFNTLLSSGVESNSSASNILVESGSSWPSYEKLCASVIKRCLFLILGVKAAISGEFLM